MIYLRKMTRELAHSYHQGFQADPDLYADASQFREYVYVPEQVDAHCAKQIKLGREHLAVMLDGVPIGDAILKDIDHPKLSCTLSIHLRDDSVKNKGFGTQAEIQLLEYAFEQLGMETVYADALLKNKRSQHVLEKVGFTETHRDNTFQYYRCSKATWIKPQPD